MWSNVHTHTNFCDGKNSAEEIVASASDLACLGISSHAPLPFKCSWCMAPERLHDYLEEIGRLKKTESKFPVYAGLEVDYIPEKISPDHFQNLLDFTIGSIHFVEQLSDGRYWEVDGSRLQFTEGLEDIFKGDAREAVVRYFELTREMVEKAPPNILGHLDKIKIQNSDDRLFREDDTWYRHEIIKTLDAIADSPCIVEVNTRGLYQKKSKTSYPSPWILSLINQRNIPITLSSDAHQAGDVTRCFSDNASMLLRLGFETLSVLVDGRWVQTKFDTNGLVIE